MNPCPITRFFVLLLLITVSFSCTDREADRSLSVEEFMKLGMPDPAKKWDMGDYKQAYNVLAKTKWEDPLKLPARDSDQSGLLFKHMVGLDYLSFLKDSTISLNEKAGRISEFTKVYDYWMDIYTIPILRKNHYPGEIVEIQLFNLHLMEAMLNLAHRINQSDDPADVALRYGYNAIKENYLACLHTDLRTQLHSSEFPERELDRMTDSIYASVMRNKEWMDSSTVNDLTRSLNLVVDSTSSDHIRNKYASLSKSLMNP